MRLFFLFLPMVREESVIKEMSPCRPVVTGFTYAEVLVIYSVLVEGFPEGFDAHIEHTLLFCASLPDEQVIYLVIGFGVIEEFTEGLFRSIVACAENTEVSKKVQGLQAYEYGVTATH